MHQLVKLSLRPELPVTAADASFKRDGDRDGACLPRRGCGVISNGGTALSVSAV